MFKYLLLLNALAISAVAAYYSILGLIVIFAASAIPVAVMATSLEVGKLMTATYLHNHWKQTGWLLKSYLTSAVVLLMFITSLGIFGFLSKAHIEQGLDSKQVTQQIEQIDRQISRLENDADVSLQRANELISSKRLQTNNEIESLSSQVRAAQRNLDALSQATQLNDVRQIQTIVGVQADGRFGPNTERSVQSFRLRQESIINEINARIKDLNDRLQNEISNVKTLDVTDEVKKLIDQRFSLEKQITKLEAEVGPIKYVAEVIYGESNNNLLEEAVRWMIIVIVFVFDPLAIALLLAFNTLHYKRKEEENVTTTKEPIEETYVLEETRTTTSAEKEIYYYKEDSEGYYFEEEDSDKKVSEEQPLHADAPPTNKRRGKHSAARKQLNNLVD